MSFQPIEEKESERQLIRRAASAFNSHICKKSFCEILKLQNDDDDGEADGRLKFAGKDDSYYMELDIEVRRKGYPNHHGETLHLPNGWQTYFLKDGIFINEITLRKHRGHNFIYLVEIKGFPPRMCVITSEQIETLLKTARRWEKSTNSKSSQSVKCVPLEWFRNITC
jgi:hypothetical protein